LSSFYASNSCITVTAHDANMRGFGMYIPQDCLWARNTEEHTWTLAQLDATVGANLLSSTSLKLPNLTRAEQISQRGGEAHSSNRG
jgi:nicotinamidase-related amidase